MKTFATIFIAVGMITLALTLTSCSKDIIKEKVVFEECMIDNIIKSKERAIESIKGKWKWIGTRSPSRILNTTLVETPESSNKSMTYKFEKEKLSIYENNALIEEYNYDIRYWGEGTTLEEKRLIVSYTSSNTQEFLGRSILYLSQSLTCLTLINSYDDAGNDIYLKRID